MFILAINESKKPRFKKAKMIKSKKERDKDVCKSEGFFTLFESMDRVDNITGRVADETKKDPRESLELEASKKAMAIINPKREKELIIFVLRFFGIKYMYNKKNNAVHAAKRPIPLGLSKKPVNRYRLKPERSDSVQKIKDKYEKYFKVRSIENLLDFTPKEYIEKTEAMKKM